MWLENRYVGEDWDFFFQCVIAFGLSFTELLFWEGIRTIIIKEWFLSINSRKERDLEISVLTKIKKIDMNWVKFIFMMPTISKKKNC